ncbi:MAG: hypothetical protein IJ482_03295 [Alphaproteobacteria bacterium]|nr:hypothetical protein [Alphaproteobacteria bacterium]
MKIKNVIAASMPEALARIKAELGDDAVILSNETVDGRLHLTVAVDETTDFDFAEDESVKEIDTRAFFDETSLREALEYHGVLDLVRYHVLSACREANRQYGRADDMFVMQKALQKTFRFRPLFEEGSGVKMFMGTPGSGKSTAIAKIATQAKLKGIKTAVVSTDNTRAGANKQLEAFAGILEVDFLFYKEARELFRYVKNHSAEYGCILIDTPGINPFVKAELDKVAPFADSLKCDKILTFDAGRNVYEAVEAAEIFGELGATGLLPTRLDLTRRVGSILSIADCCNMALSGASVSSSIARGMAELDAGALAKLILS